MSKKGSVIKCLQEKVLCLISPYWEISNILRSYHLSHAGSAILSVMFAISKCDQCIEFTENLFVSDVAFVIAIGQCE